MVFIILLLSSKATAEVFVDKTERRVNIPSPPRRIVSLAPSITETLFALGLDREIVGVTMLSNYPDAARSKPRVGTFINISLERVVSLNPDLVIGTADGNKKETVNQLEGMGIPVYVVNPENLAEILHMILSIGRITGREDEATALARGLRERIGRVASSLKGLKRPQVFLQIGINPVITVGRDTLHNELIQRAGGANIYGETATRYPRCSMEDIIVKKPDIIIVSSMKRGGDFSTVRDGWGKWGTIPAVRDDRIHVIDTDLIDLASPRIVDGLERMAEIIHPEVSLKKR
ncbi:MAG: cobalamin-binding protein [Syntrophales bacterium]|nr:cobalamin-binding protein [Syntrophales bacterium]